MTSNKGQTSCSCLVYELLESSVWNLFLIAPWWFLDMFQHGSLMWSNSLMRSLCSNQVIDILQSYTYEKNFMSVFFHWISWHSAPIQGLGKRHNCWSLITSNPYHPCNSTVGDLLKKYHLLLFWTFYLSLELKTYPGHCTTTTTTKSTKKPPIKIDT